MTQEERQLLLIDLASRIPYKVIGQVTFNRSPKQPCKKVIDGNLYDRFARAQDNWYDNVQIIPYLRPMQTITDKEIEERNQTQIHRVLLVQLLRVSRLLRRRTRSQRDGRNPSRNPALQDTSTAQLRSDVRAIHGCRRMAARVGSVQGRNADNERVIGR